ncbi:hypothetical protein VTO73DRAFT_4540 [Trametes versicolor]
MLQYYHTTALATDSDHITLLDALVLNVKRRGSKTKQNSRKCCVRVYQHSERKAVPTKPSVREAQVRAGVWPEHSATAPLRRRAHERGANPIPRRTTSTWTRYKHSTQSARPP